jgi:hypothetical protein
MKTALLLVLIFCLYLTITIWNWHYTWDDSAITLAFAHTFVETGDIKPTPLSDRVEGYSTFLWMLFMTIPFRLGLSIDTVFSLAKTLTTLLNLANSFFSDIISGIFLILAQFCSIPLSPGKKPFFFLFQRVFFVIPFKANS